MNKTLLFIRASAGSGKTYRLSTHYLKLLLEQPDPGKILATTFTRAAAGEILARVLKRLADAVVEPQKLATLAKDIGRPQLTASDCSTALEGLTASLHRVNIGTMDSFFSRIARTLPSLVDLPHKWSIASEADDELLSGRIIHLMASGENRARFSKAWKAFKAGACRTLNHEEMLGVLSKIRFLELAEGESAGNLPRLSAKEAERWRKVVQALPCPMKAPDKKGNSEEYANFRKAINNLLALLVEGTPVLSLADDETSKIICHLLAPEAVNCPGGGKVEMPSAWAPAMSELLEQIRATAMQRHRMRQFGLKELRDLFAPMRMDASLAAGMLTFEEVMQRVKDGVQWNDGTAETDLYFHLDCKIDNILFDEFQDTSLSQYEFFKPLVENTVAGDGGDGQSRSVFVVGDPKQAIYGWRGGDRSLIDSFLTDYPGVKPESLNVSYRSSQVVLDAVDKVFEGMRKLSAKEFNAPFELAAAKWVHNYQKHEAKHKDLRGEVNLWCLEDDAPEAQQEAIVEKVVDVIREKEPSEIAVLLRRTKWIPSIIDALRRHGIDAAPGPSGNFITDSLAVEIILAAVSFIDHPHQKSAAARLASHAAWGKNLADSAHQDFWSTSRAWTHSWYTHGAGELIAGWIRDPDFASTLSEHDVLRCSQLLALARRFDAAGGGRPDKFLEAARNEKKPGGRPAKVRVMTIHASKGLEFESVVIGDLGRGRGGGMGMPEFSHVDGVSRIVETDEILSACINRAKDREELKVGDIMGELSLLYVGLTRARSYLDIVVPKRGKTSKSFSNASLVQLLLADESKIAGQHNPLGSYFGTGSKSWAEIDGGKQADGNLPIPVNTGDVQPVLPLFDRKSPSGQEGGEKVCFGMLHGKSGGFGKKIGTAYHAWLAQIEWSQDCAGATEELVQRILDATQQDWETIPRKEAQGLLSRMLDKIKSNGPLAKAFDRVAYAKQWNVPEEQIEVWRERAFAVPVGGELWSGRFDRVVVAKTAQGTHFDVVDFKSDVINSPEEKAQKEAFYSEQLRTYKKVLGEMAGKTASISTSLVFLNEP